MPTTRDENGSLLLGGVTLEALARDARIGTPAYVYDLDAIAAEARRIHAAFDGAPHEVAYAVKANSAGPIVRTLAREGCGADVVSGGELLLALGCGIAPEKIVFSGVAKSDEEIDRALAAGDTGILAVQVESVEELLRVDARARAAARSARVALRVNPGVDKDALDTHAHIATGHDEAKFGVAREDVSAAFSLAHRSKHLEVVGVSAHVGSQFTSTEAYVAAARALFDVAHAAREKGTKLRYVDTGGGFGIDYTDGSGGSIATPADFVRVARAAQKAAGLDDLPLHIEPGRSLVGAHGVLLARVLQSKRTPHQAETPERSWLLIDAGMNDLIRPALYQARHRIVPLSAGRRAPFPVRVVGPVCESSDDFGEHTGLSEAGYVALLDAGAYGYTMASRYNGRAMPAEVFLRGGAVVAVSPRKPMEDWVDERLATGAAV
ncbi:MAG TPA: diaminopimelate decarboxylase [Polyangiaceae bacterium]|jgi:diaminopimelate decarboxylase